MTQYCYAYDEGDELYRGHCDSIEVAIEDALGAVEQGQTVWVAEIVQPEINFTSLAEYVIEGIEIQLSDECGEAADGFYPSEDQRKELADFIQRWVEKQGGFGCWKAENARKYTPDSAEYQRAVNGSTT